jgi:glycosidase
MKLFRIFLLALLLVLPGCSANQRQASWWRKAVFYEIFVRSFYDSNGDGIGDFNGITEKLDYLNDGDPATTSDLGITALWLMPIHPSPSYHGYDVINYYAVNAQYGSLADFERLLSEAHARGIRVIIDLVLNHSSSQHPFFRDALRGQDSPYYDWYLWSAQGGTNWHAAGDSYYYGLFCDCMPDLNYRNPEVTQQMQAVMHFWLQQVGVDGFRVDAARHLIEEGSQTENTPATHDWYRKNFFPVYKQIDKQAYAVGEVFGAGASMVRSYSDDQLDHVFNFEMASGFVNSAAGSSNTGVNSAIKFALSDMPDFDFATFLTNHDQNRVMSVLNGDVEKAKAAASLMLTSPGTPFIYYGEEIGMQGRKPDEDIRLPMQWSGAPQAGFTTGTPWRSPAPDSSRVNVALQSTDPGSLLSHYRSLIALRSAHPALRSEGLWLVETGSRSIYAAVRRQDGDMILVVVNLGEETISDYGLQLSGSGLPRGEYVMTPLMGQVQMPPIRVESGGRLSLASGLPPLPPHATWILQLVR